MVNVFAGVDLTGLQVFYTTDHFLSNGPVLVFYGPSQPSVTNTPVSSRIQTHVFTAAGLQSYLKLVVSPGSPLYSAVTCLPREDQGDEISRALAFSLLKYFTELPEAVKDAWTQQSLSATRPSTALGLFQDSHAAELTKRMVRIENSEQVIQHIETALCAQSVSHLDLDLVLPLNSIVSSPPLQGGHQPDSWNHVDVESRYGVYTPLIAQFGEPMFLPTSRIRRAPSKPAALNRSPTFTRAQKESLRLEMSQLLETEQRYVQKLDDLVHNIAATFRQSAQERPATSSSPDTDAIKKLFPSSLDDILRLNSAFLSAIEKSFNDTSSTAIKDMESNTEIPSSYEPLSYARVQDSIGVLGFAKTLVEWFPKFTNCYSDYLRAHSEFGPFLKTFATNAYSSFGQRVQNTGEQRLMSMLIEPVQRLPRYSLYIDNIVKQLPHKHPALRVLLRAKDVISDICSQDDASGPLSRISRIKEIIPSWPATFRPQGRFIIAVDALELQPPFEYRDAVDNPADCLLLLFAGHLVRLKKLGSSPLSAQGFMSMVENNSSSSQVKQDLTDSGLLFCEATSLDDTTFVEAGSDNIIRIIPRKPRADVAIRSPHDCTVRTFLLKGTYEGRVSRWAREFVKATVEGRFTEPEREDSKWEAHSVDADRHGLGFFTAIYEKGFLKSAPEKRAHGAIRVLIDPDKDSDIPQARQDGVEVVISVLNKGDGFWWLEIECANERSTRDLTTEADLLPVLTKRLGALMHMRQQIRNPVLTVYLLQHHSSILHSVKQFVERRNIESTENPPRQPQSPVKFFSNLFGNKSLKENPAARHEKSANSLSRLPRFDPPFEDISLASPQPGREGLVQDAGLSLVDGGGTGNNAVSDPLISLERTLSCYLLALKARKGNILGSVISRRGMADEAEVNELYNNLLENPGSLEKAAQASIDVLFAAFEKFAHIAWREKLGPVVTASVLNRLQTQMETLNAFDYDQYAEETLSELAPQNRRALSDIVGLLADLLGGMRNDGDRGALTAAFTEIIVCDGDSLAFISLFDRLVESHDMLAPERPASQGTSSAFGSFSSRTTRSTKPGSVSSKASSLSKRLGFGSLKKENDKSESPTKGSLRRKGSRKALPPDPPVDKPSLERAKSTDLGSHFVALRRPASRDASSRPGTAHSHEDKQLNNSSVEPSPTKTSSVLRRKRRSSLSDLTNLQTPSTSPFWTGSASKQIHGLFQSPALPISGGKPNSVVTPSKSPSIRELPNTKENAQPLDLLSGPQATVGLNTNRSGESQKAVLPASGASVLSERVSSGNTPPPLNVSREHRENSSGSPTKLSGEAGSPKKLRVQSPVKLRERLETHHKAIESADATLQAELAKIGEELAATGSKTTSTRPGLAVSPTKQDQAVLANLNTRLKALETKATHLTRNLSDVSSSLQRDMSSSLRVSEQKARALDVQLQQAKAENDALYSRMNEETMKVFDQVREGHGLEELKKQLKESFVETEKWRKEAARLKRENIGLRGQLPE